MYDKLSGSFSMFGKQLIAGATEYPVWGAQAVYTWPSGPMGMEIISASANDTNTAGTGVRTVQLRYLDGDFVEKTETIALNGTGVVATVATDIYRVIGLKALTVGSGMKAAGLISLRHLADTPLYGYILANDVETHQCIYTVPAGKTLILKKGIAALGSSATGKSSTFVLRSNYDCENNRQTGIKGVGGFGVYYARHETLTMDSAVQLDFTSNRRGGLAFPEKSDIIVTCVGTAAGVGTYYVEGDLVLNSEVK
jgi:hypothetical protein